MVATVFLSGCVLTPGSTVSVRAEDQSWFDSDDDGVWFPGFGKEEETTTITDLVDILAITPELVSQESMTPLPRAASSITPELQQQLLSYEYRIGKGDVLYITVYDHPELTAPAGNQNQSGLSGSIVRSDGTIFYPYIGSVAVEGMTIETVRQEITQRLDQFINNAQVDLRIMEFRSQRAYVTGQVGQPGPLAITDVPMTVLDAINQAGGLSSSANWHNVQLVRESGEELEISAYDLLNNGRLDENRLLRHGDVLNIPDIGNQKVFMMGELGAVASLAMGNLRMSLTDALAQSGGINQVAADASGVFVIRQAPRTSGKVATVYQLNARDALAFAVGARFILQPEDVVFVTTAPVTRWNRVLSQILPSLSTFLIFDGIGR
jgi:polysaccharide export outer membrane protein